MNTKEKYQTPEAEIISFDDSDIITASTVGSSETRLPRYSSLELF